MDVRAWNPPVGGVLSSWALERLPLGVYIHWDTGKLFRRSRSIWTEYIDGRTAEDCLGTRGMSFDCSWGRSALEDYEFYDDPFCFNSGVVSIL